MSGSAQRLGDVIGEIDVSWRTKIVAGDADGGQVFRAFGRYPFPHRPAQQDGMTACAAVGRRHHLSTSVAPARDDAVDRLRREVGPAPPKPFGRWLAIGFSTVLLVALAAALSFAVGRSGSNGSAATAKLPPPWKFDVAVLNGGGDINFTRQLASKVGAFGYRIERVGKAGRFGYRKTVVYFEPGGEAYARRLADQLGCGSVSPLPGGQNPRRLVVIAGPPTAACT